MKAHPLRDVAGENVEPGTLALEHEFAGTKRERGDSRGGDEKRAHGESRPGGQAGGQALSTKAAHQHHPGRGRRPPQRERCPRVGSGKPGRRRRPPERRLERHLFRRPMPRRRGR